MENNLTDSEDLDTKIMNEIMKPSETDPNKFELSIPIDELRKKKLFIATPMYGGMCAGLYTRSMLDLSAMLAQYGIPLQVYYLFNESLITRARNYAVDEFMRSGATHLMFIDADIGFDPRDILALLAMQDDASPYDIIGGAYPKKTIAWEKIKAAVDRGAADEDPETLNKYVGDYVFNPKNNTGSIPINRPSEVMELGTGFMMIRRKTLEDYAKFYPELFYKPDHVRTEHFDGSREIQAAFDTVIDPDTKRYLSEDYMFCYNVNKMGGKIWLCPWMALQHVGSYTFGGSLADLATVGVSATADVAKLTKKKK